MANIDLGNLTRYDGKIKQYTEDKYLSKNTANWQMTEKAGAVTCYPVPDTELEPVVDFSFKEVPPVNGDKSPTNPSTITGISSITVTQCETTSVDETQYTINLDNTYYGGSVNLATGEMIVTWKGVILTGEENWCEFETLQSGLKASYITATNDYPMSSLITAETRKCSHFSFADLDIVNTLYTWGSNNWRIGFRLSTDEYANVAAFKAFLASEYSNGTPVTVIYKLEYPYTVQLNSVQIKSLTALDKNTPRLNTLYTDVDSIQVGYQKHPARTAYELENAILALGGGE